MENTSYNHLAGRVNELKTENEKLKTENVKLKAELAAAVNQLEDGGLLLLEALELKRLPCNNGGIQDAR